MRQIVLKDDEQINYYLCIRNWSITMNAERHRN